ncbi:MAG: LysR family transcriptional regulator, partial [Raoultibacter sp.]
SAAAAEQFITAQGISKAIADLEKELGEPLLIRKNRGVVPTAFGREFLKRAELVKRCYTSLESFSKSYEEIPRSTLCARILVSTPDFPNMDTVKTSIESFLNAHLGITISVSFALKDTCLDALRDGSVDAVISLGESENIPDICTNTFGTIPCGLQMAKSNPLAKKSYVRLADLARVPAVFWPHHDFFNDTVMKQLDEKGV